MKTFAVAIALFSVISARAAVEAGPFTNAANGHHYYLLTTDTWTNSEAAAIALGGHLVTINDAAENQWVFDTFASYGGINRALWIGLTDRDGEGAFRWVSGEPVTYTKWNSLTHEPNNSGGGGYEEDFAYIIQRGFQNPDLVASFWNDYTEDAFGIVQPIQGVVEVNPDLVPFPPEPVVRDGQLCWQTVAGTFYQAQWKTPLSRGAWINFGPIVTGTGDEVCVSGSPRANQRRLYRILVLDAEDLRQPWLR